MAPGIEQPRWASVLHAIALYGMQPEEVEVLRLHWDDYLDEWSGDESPTFLVRLSAVVAAVAGHIWWRMRRGDPTAIPAGIALLLSAVSAASFALSDTVSELPTWTHVLQASTVFLVGLGFVLNPRLTRRRLIGLGLAANALGIPLILTQVEFLNALDVAVFGGAALFAVGSVQLTWNLARRGHVPLGPRSGATTMAIALVLVGIGNAGWTRIIDEPAYFFSCAVSSVAAVASGYFVSLVGRVEPDSLSPVPTTWD